MTKDPVLDGRTREDILERQREIAPYYVDDWNPENADAGTVLFEIFADLAEDVIERLDRVPEKHQTAFFDSLDFSTYPPQPSKVPVTFEVDDNSASNIRIEPQTQLTAPEADGRPKQLFETLPEDRFEATPAALTDLVSVDPGTDRLVDHSDALESTAPVELFSGENLQDHCLYMGHDELLVLNPGSTIELELTTNASVTAFREYLDWEYYGTDDDGEEGWHPLDVHYKQELLVAPLSEYQQAVTFIEQLTPFLESHGYERLGDDERVDVFVRSLIDDVKKGQFGPTETDDRAAEVPANLFASRNVDRALKETLQRYLGALRDQLRSSNKSNEFTESQQSVGLELGIPGEITESEHNGVESRWLRCRVPDDELSAVLFSILIEDVRLSVGSESARLPLDAAVTNDVEVDLDERYVYPLGRNPAEASTWSVACKEAFTKPGAEITLDFEAPVDESHPTAAADADPELVWEYWNGIGWQRLSVDDTTDHLQTAGTVSFTVPMDLTPTLVVGQERRWIRTRLVDGNYGEPRMEETDENSWERVTDHIHPPKFASISVQYVQSSVPFDQLLTYNNNAFRDVRASRRAVQPFVALPGTSQSLYLGFDRPLNGGPLHLYVPIAETDVPHWFSPWIEMEYCSDPTVDEWSRLDLADGTADLSVRGILAVSFPEETTAFSLFGRERHWIRLRLTGDEFSRGESGLFGPRTDRTSASSRSELYSVSVTERERAARTRSPPVIEGLFLNTQWATNVQTITTEVLGSSTGTADQRLTFAQQPVLSADVWVDELPVLSANKRAALSETDPDRVIEDRDDTGELERFWVRWDHVDDFLDSGGEARHYTLDEVGGAVEFGDGRGGAIPPAGENNVRADYTTGGGNDGDIGAHELTGLKDEMSGIAEAYNPAPGKTGEDNEPTAELLSRAPKQLRDRNRPVTRDGFERIARSAAREIGRVRCKAGADETGEPGHVTLLVVPDVDDRKPVPSEELLDQVTETMQAKAPVAVVGDDSKLSVRGPHYIEASVTATVTTMGTHSITETQELATAILTDFLHPLTGGPDGIGWEIGRCPSPALFVSRLEQLPDISAVTSLAVTFDDGDEHVTLAGAEDAPNVAADTLVYSGRHTVTVDVRRDD